MIYVIYINNKGFISTFDKVANSYTTTQDIYEADFNSKLEHAESTAGFFGGSVLALDDKEV